MTMSHQERLAELAADPHYNPRQTVISFVLPSSNARWNWPVEGKASIAAFIEILDRANIAWSVRRP